MSNEQSEELLLNLWAPLKILNQKKRKLSQDLLKGYGNLSYKRRRLKIAVDTLVSLASPDPNKQHIRSLIEDCCQKPHVTIFCDSLEIIAKNSESIFKEMISVPRFRNVLAARLTDGLSREEVANITGLSLRQIDRGRQSMNSIKLCDILHKVRFFLFYQLIPTAHVIFSSFSLKFKEIELTVVHSSSYVIGYLNTLQFNLVVRSDTFYNLTRLKMLLHSIDAM
jgi:hypothetical protein